MNRPSIATTHPQLAAQWHPTKNGTVKPQDISHGSNLKAWWRCPKSPEHEWQATVASRASGNGCPCCRGLKAVPSNCLSTLRPDIATQWHPIKNNPLTPNDVVPMSNKIVWWKCPKAADHEWKGSIAIRSAQGCGCPYCAGQKICSSNCLSTTHPELAAEWHPTLNKISPNEVTHGTTKRAWWRCGKGHKWQARIDHRANGAGCPICRMSRGENVIAKVCQDFGIQHQPQFTIKTCRSSRVLPFDFAIWKDGRMGLVEYQGKQHYVVTGFGSHDPMETIKGFQALRRADAIKKKYCQDNNVPLLIIPYWDFANIEDLVQQFIKQL